jgi:hypothetical protein
MPKDLDKLAIPLVEERLSVDKREVETGRVRVRTVEDERVVRSTRSWRTAKQTSSASRSDVRSTRLRRSARKATPSSCR